MSTAIRQLLPLIIMTAVLYMVLVIPQNKRRKEYDAMIRALKVDDEIVSTGGLIGRILEIQDTFVILQCGPDNTKLKLSKSGILQKLEKSDADTPAFKEIKDDSSK